MEVVEYVKILYNFILEQIISNDFDSIGATCVNIFTEMEINDVDEIDDVLIL